MSSKRIINYWSVVATGLIAFMLSLAWYSPLLFGEIWARYRSGAPDQNWTLLLAPLRELFASYAVALLITDLQLTNWRSAVKFVFLLWAAFHAVGMAGAVLWDHMPWQLGLVHAGDWLMKMIFMAIALSLWHKKSILRTTIG
jgi:hypothetical protein